MMYKKIMIAVDSSEYSLKAAKKGFELAQQLKAQVALIYVVDTSKALGDIETGLLPAEALDALEKEAELTLEQLSNMYKEIDIVKFTPEGHPNKDIIQTADTWGADVLVAGTHGKTGLLHLVMGSVAEHLISHSDIPVLIIPSK